MKFVCLYVCICECLLQNNNHEKKHKIILLQNNMNMSNVHCGSAFDLVRRFQATLLLRTTCMRV